MRFMRTTIIVFFIASWILLFIYLILFGRIVKTDSNNLVAEKLKTLENDIYQQFQWNKKIITSLKNAMVTIPSIEENVIAEEKQSSKKTVIAVLVIACNRVTVSRCLDQLLKHRPNSDQFPIIVSQDCGHQETMDTIMKYGSQVTLIQQPDQSDIEVPPKEKKFKGYFKIARHYGWALNQTFFSLNYDNVVIVEDDLDIAPDFFEYFLGTLPLLINDPSLWCVSAWNDNGKIGLVNEHTPGLLYRTDFFSGLGWMLTKSLWKELFVKWPKSYWDDWIRQPDQRKGRACIRPEISRTRTFGKYGVSNGMYYEKHLKYIKLNEEFVPFSKMDLSYLMKDAYDTKFLKDVNDAPLATYQQLKDNDIQYEGTVKIVYHTKEDFKRTAKLLGLMDDFRSGVPRTAYRGVITFYFNGRTVYLAPNVNWMGYNLSWS
ncbi:alpha-1,3-mannosyl-glycoprotein 2-beta-N-acetylglucosaminyltransferase [Agrilus planipennis]|uniref:Alpha-1,3-mannosyl-glycoprotein 2-beta-N-acetylglucosaminyltransferase n=1 Tax=Agrilus planipennis TaxID=224129 RepID=A0A1W4X4S2_AGRPL|nr:alpha-1,3-mannosyl-glycoprotein 2-beta-N-acetylglucosaminyltransferase [Agrilus planipennis]